LNLFISINAYSVAINVIADVESVVSVDDDLSETNDDDESRGHTAGAYFNGDKNTWMPVSKCSQHFIPDTLPEKANEYVRRRASCSDVLFEDEYKTVPQVSRDGFMIGTDCMPMIGDCICSCGRAWTEATLVSDGHFILRTYLGAVVRNKKKALCACGVENRWSPASEYVHTIDSDSEGGK
jgi:hypothetical protein